MKSIFELILIIFMLFTNTACGEKLENNTSQNESGSMFQTKVSQSSDSENALENEYPLEIESVENESKEDNMISINVIVGDSVFSAKLYDNEAVESLLSQFPITLNMSDLNSNEKYCYLAENLPSESSEKPETINAGDIMCWSGNCLVLFYETFSNSYGGYVRLGYIEDVSGLAAALGDGSVQVTFE